MFAVTLSAVEKVYCPNTPKKVNALKNLSLQIKRGQMAAVMGASGSGKSTLLRIIGCLDRPTSGAVHVLGYDTGALSEKKRASLRSKDIGFVLQDFGLIANRSALENVMIPMYFSNISLRQGKKDALDALIRVGLSDKITEVPANLSGGQQQRVAIARAIASRCDLLLADEPTGALDIKTGDEIMEIFKTLKQGGCTCVIVTHNPRIAEQCDVTFNISDGELVDGSL
ncbi:MAG: ABC transporter ATP-binding protein [Clostridia bacterium]|nr:ABC transporter ATP-binding protein [Clostridia bacterium]